MKRMLFLGIIAMALMPALGCKEKAPPEQEAETQELYESQEYEQEMMGETPTGEEQ